MKRKKLTEYPKFNWVQYPCMDIVAMLRPTLQDSITIKTMESGEYCLIPAADAERYDRENAAKDAVVEAAGEPVKRLIKLGGCTGEICNECIDGCQHYPYCLALAALKQVRDE